MTIDDVITMLNSEDCMLATAGMCLMRYKERDCWKCILKEYSKTVYNKAIDDFIRKCEMESRVILDEIIHLSYYGLSMKELQRIAEQLKAGGENE